MSKWVSYFELLLLAIKSTALYLIAKLLYKQNNVWLISERGNEARDNGYIFFKYLKENHPEIKSYFVISENSVDYPKLLKYRESILFKDSWSHFKILSQASIVISTHIGGYLPYKEALGKIDKKINLMRDKKRVFLQHGIIKDYIPRLFGDRVYVDLFCCGAKLEYDYICKNYRYPQGVVKYTGLCRYDNLTEFTKKKIVLVMPTWRSYINRKTFEQSEYFITYKNLLTNKKVHDLLQIHGYSLIFYPHYEFQTKIDLFKDLKLPSNVIVAGQEYDVQSLLKDSSLLITDYSSVYFDMLYMNKPTILYQFDYDKFREFHYQKGYLNESDLGDVVKKENELIELLEKKISTGCLIENEYVKFGEILFAQRDNHNCDRVFESIINI